MKYYHTDWNLYICRHAGLFMAVGSPASKKLRVRVVGYAYLCTVHGRRCSPGILYRPLNCTFLDRHWLWSVRVVKVKVSMVSGHIQVCDIASSHLRVF